MQVFIFLADGFEEIEAIVPVDVFRRAGLKVTTVSITDELNVRGAHDVTIMADACFADVRFDEEEFLIFLPGGMPGTTNLGNHTGLKAVIASQAAQNQKIAAICAAPSILGKMGLLKNKEAVVYPGFENLLLDAELSSSKIVKAGNIFTGKGPGVSIPFALRIVEELQGKEVADEIAKAMIV